MTVVFLAVRHSSKSVVEHPRDSVPVATDDRVGHLIASAFSRVLLDRV